MYSDLKDLYENYTLYRPTINISFKRYELMRIDHDEYMQHHVYKMIDDKWSLVICVDHGKVIKIEFMEYMD